METVFKYTSVNTSFQHLIDHYFILRKNKLERAEAKMRRRELKRRMTE